MSFLLLIRSSFISVVIILSFLCFYSTNGTSCSHKGTDIRKVKFHVRTESAPKLGRHRRYLSANSLKIMIYYDEYGNKLPTYMKEVIFPRAIEYFAKALQLREPVSMLRLDRSCPNDEVFKVKQNDGYFLNYCVNQCEPVTYCGPVVVPTAHLHPCRVCGDRGFDCRILSDAQSPPSSNEGIADVDFVLYVTQQDNERCQGADTKAYASYCQLEAKYDRPIAGYVNICPHSIPASLTDYGSLLATVKHEIFHSLGFSSNLFAFFRDSLGRPLVERDLKSGLPPFDDGKEAYIDNDNVVQKVERKQWKVRHGYVTKTSYFVVTPNVVREVRNHFNCPDLEGAELEDQGGDGTALTHWEKRVFEHEAMTGTYTQNPVFSRVTLALMEDSGWYIANYSQGEDLDWGKNLGCEFVKKSCKEWIDSQSDPHPFCTRPMSVPSLTQCTKDRMAVAHCNLVQYEQILEATYQYFDNLTGIVANVLPNFGGRVQLADYCPYLQEFNWQQNGVILRSSRCLLELNNRAFLKDPLSNYALERYGPQSRCFEHTGPWIHQQCNVMYKMQDWGAGCYQYSCEPSQGLVLEVEGKSFPCTREGMVIQVQVVSNGWLYRGNIKCPACNELCNECPARLMANLVALERLPVPCPRSSDGRVLKNSVLATFSTIFLSHKIN